jgi:hypothetical protein
MEFKITPARAIAAGVLLLAAGYLFPSIRQARAPQAPVTLEAPPQAGGTAGVWKAGPAPLFGEIQEAGSQSAGGGEDVSAAAEAGGEPIYGPEAGAGLPEEEGYSGSALPAGTAFGQQGTGGSYSTGPGSASPGAGGRLSGMKAGSPAGLAGENAKAGSAAAKGMVNDLTSRVRPVSDPSNGHEGAGASGAGSPPGVPAAATGAGARSLSRSPNLSKAPRASNPSSPQSSEQSSPSSTNQAGAGKLSSEIIQRAGTISVEINQSGGYRFDGRNDCYGFVRRVWDPVLTGKGLRPLPVSDMVSQNWAPITAWTLLVPGDALSTHQGHMWGPNWHGGLFFGMVGGKAYSFDNSPSNKGGAYPRIAPSGVFHYYYIPTHKLLGGG